MEATVKVGVPPLEDVARGRAGRKAIVLWMAVIVVLAIAGATLALTLARNNETTSPLAPSQGALQRHHAEAFAPVGSTTEVSELQAALQRLKEDASTTSTRQSATGEEAFKRLKAGY